MLKQLIYKKKLTIKDLPKCLPFKNTQDLLDFNNVSEDEYQEVVFYLQHIGGANHDDAAALYFKKSFKIEDDDLPKNVTWLGSKTKTLTALKDTRFATACGSAMSDSKNFDKPTNSNFATAMTKALKSLKEDYRRRKAKRARTDNLQVDNIQQPQNKRARVVPNHENIYEHLLDSDVETELPKEQDLVDEDSVEPSAFEDPEEPTEADDNEESGEPLEPFDGEEFEEATEELGVQEQLENGPNAYNVTVLRVLAAPDLQSTIYGEANEYDEAIVPEQANKENLFEDSDTIVVEGLTIDEFENTQLIYQGYEENRGVYGIEEN
ncbi:uncharacterized protein LOC103315449 [Nasonia vitripennis]|uniref:Uncharacterized protein n=1 Tax=Nasonia vitripennis TaxID=7425 RepID=A0A7M7Q036_NASVI|nr:uncharacterized protein LOC103315449 [Nasonia vitripennis]